MPGLVHVSTTINGNQADFLCEPRQSLLECLRDVVGMTGTKEGCNDGNCGGLHGEPGRAHCDFVPGAGGGGPGRGGEHH